jgi:hypothetical protein
VGPPAAAARIHVQTQVRPTLATTAEPIAEPGPWSRPSRTLLLLMLLVVPIFAATAVYGGDMVNIDTEPVALTSWRVATSGTPDLTGVETDNQFVIDTPRGRLTGRPPGLWLVAVPAYVVVGGDYSFWPSTVMAVLVAAGAVAVVYLVLLRCIDRRWALAGTLVFAFGTATWPISADQLWPHGPGQLLLALAMLALASGRSGASGMALAAAVLVRPVVGAVPAVLTVARARHDRWQVLRLLAPVAVAGIAVVAYNRWAFGSWSISGGYPPWFRDNLTDQSIPQYFSNLGRFFVGPNGMLLWSPFLIVAALGIPRAWSTAPPWARQCAVAGLVYVLLHARLNRASGGLPYTYRYPLESLTLAAPLLLLSTRAWVGEQTGRLKALVVVVGVSVFLQGAVATTVRCDHDAEGPEVPCYIL